MALRNSVFYTYALLAAAFLADINLPPDVAGGLCYVVPILVCLRYCEIKHFAWAVGLSIAGIVFDLIDTTMLYDWRATPPLNAAAALVAILVSSWFVRQLNRTRLKEALAHETMQALLHGVINNAPALIAVKDRQGRYTMINQGLRDEWGPAAEGLLGRTGPEASPDRVFSKKMHEQDIRLMRDEEINTALEKFPIKPKKTFYTTRFPLYDTQNKVVGLGGVSLDVTELIDARSTIEKQNRELAVSIQELQRFAQVTAHDLQEPLRMMTSFSELLLEDLGDKVEGESREYLQYIARNARHSQRQIKDLLIYSNLQSITEPVCVSLDSVVQTAARNVLKDPESQIIRWEALPQVSGNAKQLQQLFEHLFANALKFTANAPPQISVSSVEVGTNHIDVMVHDNGIGVDAEHADHIFEIFTRLHDREAMESTGIGLALCRRIMQLHHGGIRVKSNEDGGSTFVCSFPIED